MAASCSSQLSLLLARDGSLGHTSSSGPAPMCLNLCPQLGFVGRSPLRHLGSISVAKGLGYGRRTQHVMGARRPGKDRDGALAQAVVEIKVPDDNSEPDDMFMGRKLEGLEPDFWEGDQWNALGFIIQYLWAFGILIALVACGVAVTSYNSGAVDIRETDIFKEALKNQENASFDSDSFQDYPQTSEAPSLE
jgi:hypothetical protein